MKRKHHHFEVLIVVVVAILLSVVGIFLFNESNPVAELPYTRVNIISTVDLTVQAEEEIILQLTEQPDSVQSITPYYIEILYNEALRHITATPTIDPFQPTPACWLVADFWQLYDVANDIDQTLEQSGFHASAEVFVSVVWNVNDCDSYVPVSNRVRIWIEEDTMLTPEAFHTVLTEVAKVIGYTSNAKNITLARSNVEIMVNFVSGDGNVYLNTNLAELDILFQEKVSFNELIDVLRTR